MGCDGGITSAKLKKKISLVRIRWRGLIAAAACKQSQGRVQVACRQECPVLGSRGLGKRGRLQLGLAVSVVGHESQTAEGHIEEK